MNNYHQHLFFIVAFILNALPAFSQNYIFDYQSYGVEDGLLHREVNALNQDGRGFIWLGTKGPLNRFAPVVLRAITRRARFIGGDIAGTALG